MTDKPLTKLEERIWRSFQTGTYSVIHKQFAQAAAKVAGEEIRKAFEKSIDDNFHPVNQQASRQAMRKWLDEYLKQNGLI